MIKPGKVSREGADIHQSIMGQHPQREKSKKRPVFRNVAGAEISTDVSGKGAFPAPRWLELRIADLAPSAILPANRRLSCFVPPIVFHATGNRLSPSFVVPAMRFLCAFLLFALCSTPGWSQDLAILHATGSILAPGHVVPMSAPIATAAVAEAHRHHQLVFAHSTNLEGTRVATDSGVDVLAHAPEVTDGLDDRLLQQMVACHMARS